MFDSSRYLPATFFALLFALLPGQLVSAQENSVQQPNVTVLSTGPIHEAYAQPALKDPQPPPIVPKKPPEPVPEEPPAQKPQGKNVQWIPGYWAWDAQRNDFIWVSGFWRQPPPDRKWVPGYWTQADNGWQWTPGYWAPASQETPPHVPPPPASLDNGPSVPAPNDDSFYVPGSWMFRDTGYVWRPGFWSPSYDDWVWNPACYSWSPDGSVYNSGYWDYPLADRGQLFAPVYFNNPLWATTGFPFTPSYVINPFLSSLFWPPYSPSFFYGNPFAAPFFFPSLFPYSFFPGLPPFFSFGSSFFRPHRHFVGPGFRHGGFPWAGSGWRGGASFGGAGRAAISQPQILGSTNRFRSGSIAPGAGASRISSFPGGGRPMGAASFARAAPSFRAGGGPPFAPRAPSFGGGRPSFSRGGGSFHFSGGGHGGHHR
jgi:hypothetical protein